MVLQGMRDIEDHLVRLARLVLLCRMDHPVTDVWMECGVGPGLDLEETETEDEVRMVSLSFS